MRKSILLFSFSFLFLFFSCKEQGKSYPQIIIENTTEADRSLETVSIELENFKIENLDQSIVIRDFDSKEELISQVVDNDGDKRMDHLLFQPEIPAKSKKTFEVIFTVKTKETDSIPIFY